MEVQMKIIIFAMVVITMFFHQQLPCKEEIKSKSITTPAEIWVVKKDVIKISVGESKVISSLTPITKAATGNPAVADVVVISQREILINGKGVGTTSLVVWEGENIRVEYEIIVTKEQVATEVRTFNLQNIWLKKYDYKITQGKIEITISSSPSLVEEVSNIIATLVEKEKFSVNAELNTIVVSAPRDTLQKVEDLIKEIDVPKEQVSFEAKIAEVRESSLKELGLSWGLQDGKVRAVYNKDELVTEIVSYEGEDKKLVTRIVSSELPQDYLATIKALEEKGKIEILASPKITVRSGEIGRILVGSRVPVIKVTVDQAGNRTETVEFVEVGVSLSILPTKISKEGNITALITPLVSNITEWKGNYPVIATRESTSEVGLKDKEGLIIGGLLSSREYYNFYKVPILSDIPILGNLFKNKKREIEKTELIIIIMPNVIK